MHSRYATAAALTATAGLVAGGLAYAALYPTSQIFGRVLLSGRDPREIALTFDDGPNPATTPKLLEVLAQHRVHASFFLIGNFVRQQRSLTRAICEAGHLIGNHTMTHPRLAGASASRIKQEIFDTNSLLEDTTGSEVRYFRPPFGSRRPYVMQCAKEIGLTTVLWNVTAHDWNSIGTKGIITHIERGIARNQTNRRGSNLLLHDGGHLGLYADRSATIEATANLLRLRSANSFVTVDAWR